MAIVGYDWRENVNNLNVCVHTHMSTTGCIHYQSRMCIANYIVFTVTPHLPFLHGCVTVSVGLVASLELQSVNVSELVTRAGR